MTETAQKATARPNAGCITIEQQAQWLRDAIAASKEARLYAMANYDPSSAPTTSKVDSDLKRQKIARAIDFHLSESGQNADIQDALLDAMKWHMPPEEFREYVLFDQIQRLKREIATLREKAARDEQQRKQMELISSQYVSDPNDYDDEYDD